MKTNNNNEKPTTFDFNAAFSFLAFVGYGLLTSLLSVGWPFIRDEFGLSDADQGLYGTVTMVGSFAASFLSGRMASKWGTGGLLAASTGLIAVGLLGQGMAFSWWFMIAAGVVAGFGSGLMNAGVNAYIAARYSALLMTWLHVFFGIGSVISPRVMTWLLASGYSWRTGYLIGVGVQFALMIVFLLTLRRWRIPEIESAAEEESGDSDEEEKPGIRETLSLPEVWAAIAMFVAFSGLAMTASKWLFTFYKDGRGIEIGTAGVWFSGYRDGYTLVRVVGGTAGLIAILAARREREGVLRRINAGIGRVRAHLSPVNVLRLCIIGAGTSALVIGLDLSGFANAFATFTLGFSLGTVYPLLVSVTPNRIDARHVANAVGFQVAAGSVSGSVIPWIAGVFAEWFGFEVIPVLLVIFAVLMFTLNEITARRARRADLSTSEAG